MTRRPGPAPPPLAGALLGLAAAFGLAYLAVALFRLGYPYELEWIEGGSLSMVQRVLDGRPLYVAPSLEYIPFNYTPLYYIVSAGFARILGEGFLPLRLVSLLASLACAALIARLVALETRDRLAPVLAAGLYLATFHHAGSWFDVARSDSLALALLLGAFTVLRADPRPLRAGVAGGLLAALAFLAKQSAIVGVLPVAGLLLFAERRRGIAFAATVAALLLGSTLAGDAASGGWYRYYVFSLAGRYPADPALAARFWTRDLIGPLGISVLGGIYAALAPGGETPRRGRLTWAAVLGLVLSAWVVRAYPATYDNVLMPACAAAAILFGLGWDAACASGAAPRRVAFAALAGLLQFSILLYNPPAQVPSRRDREQGDRLLEGLRRAPGSVLVPCHDYLSVRAGKGAHFHEMSFMAVAKSGADTTATRVLGQLRAALAEHHWSTIVVDKADWLWDELERDYEPRLPIFPDERSFWPVTGMHRRPEVIFLPRTTPLPATP